MSRLPLSLYICRLRDFTVHIKRLCWNIRSCWKPMASSPILMKDDESWQYLWYISYGHMRVKPNVCVLTWFYIVSWHKVGSLLRPQKEVTWINLFQADMPLLQNISCQSLVYFVHLHVGSSNYTITIVSEKCFAMVGRKCKSRQTGCMQSSVP